MGTRLKALAKSSVTRSIWSPLSIVSASSWCEQLGFAATPGPETMLTVCQYLMFFKVCHYTAGDDVLLQLTTYAGR